MEHVHVRVEEFRPPQPTHHAPAPSRWPQPAAPGSSHAATASRPLNTSRNPPPPTAVSMLPHAGAVPPRAPSASPSSRAARPGTCSPSRSRRRGRVRHRGIRNRSLSDAAARADRGRQEQGSGRGSRLSGGKLLPTRQVVPRPSSMRDDRERPRPPRLQGAELVADRPAGWSPSDQGPPKWVDRRAPAPADHTVARDHRPGTSSS